MQRLQKQPYVIETMVMGWSRVQGKYVFLFLLFFADTGLWLFLHLTIYISDSCSSQNKRILHGTYIAITGPIIFSIVNTFPEVLIHDVERSRNLKIR